MFLFLHVWRINIQLFFLWKIGHMERIEVFSKFPLQILTMHRLWKEFQSRKTVHWGTILYKATPFKEHFCKKFILFNYEIRINCNIKIILSDIWIIRTTILKNLLEIFRSVYLSVFIWNLWKWSCKHKSNTIFIMDFLKVYTRLNKCNNTKILYGSESWTYIRFFYTKIESASFLDCFFSCR